MADGLRGRRQCGTLAVRSRSAQYGATGDDTATRGALGKEADAAGVSRGAAIERIDSIDRQVLEIGLALEIGEAPERIPEPVRGAVDRGNHLARADHAGAGGVGGTARSRDMVEGVAVFGRAGRGKAAGGAAAGAGGIYAGLLPDGSRTVVGEVDVTAERDSILHRIESAGDGLALEHMDGCV